MKGGKKSRRKMQKELDLQTSLEFLKQSDGKYHHLTREQISEKEKYRF